MSYPVVHNDRLGTRVLMPQSLDMSLQFIRNVRSGVLPEDAVNVQDLKFVNDGLFSSIESLKEETLATYKELRDSILSSNKELRAEMLAANEELRAEMLAANKELRDDLVARINKASYRVKVLGECVREYTLVPRELAVPTASKLVNFFLPVSPGIGRMFRVGGFGHGGWKINQAEGQIFHIGDTKTTEGKCGSLSSSCGTDSVEFICTESGSTTAFLVVSMIGDLYAV